ncbi:MAG: GNAT family N-acetyltransferase [Bacteroidales bacterium]
MFYLQKDNIRLMPAFPNQNDIFNYQEIRHLGEARLMENFEGNILRFNIERKGETMGEILLHNIKWLNRKAMLTVFIWPPFQGQGIGRTASEILLDFSFRVMNLVRIEAEVVQGNEASLRLIRSLGFVEEGRLRKAKYIEGQYYDIFVFGLLKEEWDQKI